MGDAIWKTLPPATDLPRADRESVLEVDGGSIWHAHYGTRHGGPPVLLLHGGFGNAQCYAGSITALADAGYHIIAMDSRGHGRSTHDGSPLSYARMAGDVVSLLDSEDHQNADIVGWSDGGCIGYALGIAYPSRLSRLFAFGANMDHSCYPGDIEQVVAQPAFSQYLARAEEEYAGFVPDAEKRERTLTAIHNMWAKEPHFEPEDLRTIVAPTTIALGQYDEAITLDHAVNISTLIPNSNLVILPNVSHFAATQNPELFTDVVLSFLKWR